MLPAETGKDHRDVRKGYGQRHSLPGGGAQAVEVREGRTGEGRKRKKEKKCDEEKQRTVRDRVAGGRFRADARDRAERPSRLQGSDFRAD